MVKQVIDAEDLREDIRSGMGGGPIMEKYRISRVEFMDILESLKGVDPTDLEIIETRLKELRKDCDPSDMRSTPRNYMVVPATVRDAHDPSVRGLVNDITENGLQVEGIRAYVDEKRSFIFGCEVLSSDTEIAFEAVCRWAKRAQGRQKDVAGFEITSISHSSLLELRNLMRYLSLGAQP